MQYGQHVCGAKSVPCTSSSSERLRPTCTPGGSRLIRTRRGLYLLLPEHCTICCSVCCSSSCCIVVVLMSASRLVDDIGQDILRPPAFASTPLPYTSSHLASRISHPASRISHLASRVSRLVSAFLAYTHSLLAVRHSVSGARQASRWTGQAVPPALHQET
jgi:hypothetical protein